MPRLHEVQGALGRDILSQDAGSVAEAKLGVEAILGDGLDPAARLRIYANHYRSSLTEALKAVYPAVCRLVDERFFAFAADRFIEADPPRRPCLFEYGEGFADFLSRFPPCRSLPYLPDLARLEWAINAALHARAEPSLTPEDLAAIPPADYPQLVFRLQPSLHLLASPWPIDRIWRAGQPGAGERVDLAEGGCRLEIRQLGEEVVFRRLEPGAFDLRSALAAGRPLEAALAVALAAHPQFDPAMALRQLIGEGLIAGCSLAGPDVAQPKEVQP